MLEGVGLHTGLTCNLVIKPANPNSGIVFKRVDVKENNIVMVKPSPKHRYFYLCGSKSQNKTMMKKLNYQEVTEYPKLNPS